MAVTPTITVASSVAPGQIPKSVTSWLVAVLLRDVPPLLTLVPVTLVVPGPLQAFAMDFYHPSMQVCMHVDVFHCVNVRESV